MEYLWGFEFALPGDEEYIDFEIKVPHTPMDSITPTGYIAARLKIDWSTLKQYPYDITLEAVTEADTAVVVKTDNIGSKTEATAILALYDADMRLISARRKAVSIDSGKNTFTFDNVDISAASEVKVMLWSSAGEMNPIAKAIVK